MNTVREGGCLRNYNRKISDGYVPEEDRSVYARRRLYSKIVKEYYKEKKAKARVEAMLKKKAQTEKKTGK